MEHPDNVIHLPVRRRASSASALTFGVLAQRWLAVERHRLVEPENERRHIEHLRALWALTEGELGPRAVKAALTALLAPAGPLGPATVNKVRATGRRIIRDAQENEEWRGLNPFDVVRRARQSRPSFRSLSLKEARAVLPHLREDRRLEALVTLYLGLRTGELLALRWEDVDLQAGILVVRRSHGRSATKTGKVRTVPLPSPLRAQLEALLTQSVPGRPLVFPGTDGRRQRADSKKSAMLQEALRKAGLVEGWDYSCRRKGCGHREQRAARAAGLACPRCGMKLWEHGRAIRVRWYDLRHSCATLHREAGADPLAIQLLLGHAPKSLTDSTYTHLSMEYLRRELSKLVI